MTTRAVDQLTDDELAAVRAVAISLPDEKRVLFLARLVAMLDHAGGTGGTGIDGLITLALTGLHHAA
jgi:hypothetical protein